jgi:2-oxoisovalerate dehydrogenase E1 component
MLLIRRFEERLLSEFSTGRLVGTTHTYIGQEANAAAIFAAADPGDVVFSNHRCHGHFLAYGGDPYQLAAELMGKATGLVGGRGGSQHIQWCNFYSNGIQGGIVPVATGMAMAEKIAQTGKLALVFLGDGTLGEGAVYESLNLASLWSLPVVYIVENNRYAQTTPTELAIAGSMTARFEAFGIKTWELDSPDVLSVMDVAREALTFSRQATRPVAVILHTYRFAAHSKGDDVRDAAEVTRYKEQNDPLTTHAPRLTPDQRAEIEAEVSAIIEDAFSRAYADRFPVLQLTSSPDPVASPTGKPQNRETAKPTSVLESLTSALLASMTDDPRVHILGEDILDPYGGAFKVTRGLSSAFPERVHTTPISEAAILGVANGLALRGLRPVVEIMFGDFVTLIADQIINHAAKFRWMYNDKVRVPLVVRAPMGGRRGYGPTHSQNLEKHFLGVPGLKTIAPNALGNPGDLLRAAIADDDPVLFVEHKLLYTRPLLDPQKDLPDWQITQTGDPYPTFTLTIPNYQSQITLATYGYNFELARAAAQTLLMEHEIFCEIVLFSQLSPFELTPLTDSLARTRRLVTVEEGGHTLGWGAEVAARAAEALPGIKIARVAARDLPIANAKTLEDAILPSTEQIIEAAQSLI